MFKKSLRQSWRIWKTIVLLIYGVILLFIGYKITKYKESFDLKPQIETIRETPIIERNL